MKEMAVKLHSTEMVMCNIIKVEAGTNTPRGGDASHGGKTIIRLTNLASTAWNYSVTTEDGIKIDFEQPHDITLTLFGDHEADTVADALEWAARTIRKIQQRNNEPDRNA